MLMFRGERIYVKAGKLVYRRVADGGDSVQNKKLRQIKAAKDLYRKSDERIIGYEKCQLLKILANRFYHSLEISESDEENPDKTILKNLLRNVIDSHSADIQTAKLQRPRHRSGFDEDEDYGEETEEVLIDSQKSAAGDDLAK
ncbi:uncharacterized protein OCT59_008944 [Rhizophagus irregularis]|uniref:uncharacterized protein n=1 Tax=Rhizophagus irregularis TaxID=588596 RepID=UPI003331343A|nr:hypothetical protein OCT59_008944 [Rhizophagus irregularis]